MLLRTDRSQSANQVFMGNNSRKFAVEQLEPRYLLSVVIREFMADNENTVADTDGEYSDWIELHNTSPDTVNLGGWSLTDDGDELDEWQLPNVPLAANDYLVVFASGKDRSIAGEELHTNFKLDKSGEYLGLVRPDGTTIEFEYAPAFPEQRGDISYGLGADAVSRGYFLAPTPGTANIGTPLNDPDRSVVITEIMYNLPTRDVLDAENVGEEFFELHNRGIAPINLAGWQVDKGVSFTFPDVTIQPNDYLVVAADVATFRARYPTVTNVVGGWTGKLSNSSETIRVVDDAGVTMDQVTYADEGNWSSLTRGPLDRGSQGWVWDDSHDGGGKSLELVNLNVSNNHGQNWTASLPENGTPGAPNSVADSSTAPLILDLQHNPPIPSSTEPVTVSARLVDESTDGVSAQLYWRVDVWRPTGEESNFMSLEMTDDGANGDVRAGDGIFSATIPRRRNSTIIEFYVSASDAAENTRTWPPPAGESGQVTNALYQVLDGWSERWEPGSTGTYFQIMTAAERIELDNIDRASNAKMNATFISFTGTGIDVVHNAGVRMRGHSSRNRTPPNNRIDFPSDNPWHGVTGINLNVVAIENQIAGSVLFQLAGLPTTEARPVTMFSNGIDLRRGRFYAHLEVPNDEFAANHFPLDPGGNVYKGRRAGESNGLGAGLEYFGPDPTPYLSYEKSTNEGAADWSDVIELTDVLNNTPDDEYRSSVEAVVDVKQWLRVLALTALLGNSEGGLFTGDRGGDDYGLYRGINDPRFVFLPHDMDTLFGSTTGQIFPARGVPALDRMLDQPAYLAEYYRQLVDLIDNVVMTATTGAVLETFIRPILLQSQIDQIETFLAERGAFIKSQIPAEYLNPGVIAPTSQATVTGTATNLQINEVLASNQTSFIHNATAPDYIELYNAGNTSVDLAGYSLTDNPNTPRKFVFPTGSVLASGSYLTVLASAGPNDDFLHTGFSLKSEGEAVYLFDSPAHGGSLLDSIVFGLQVVDFSIGRGAHGDWALNRPTPNAPNVVQTTGDVGKVSINEWLATGQVTGVDDFIELYNADVLPVAVGGMYLSDKPNTFAQKHRLAPLSFIAAGGFATYLADGDTTSGPNHLGFRLSADHELMALFGENLVEVDRILFSWQGTDISQGRSPDGQSGHAYYDFPTPGLANPLIATTLENIFDYSAIWAYDDFDRDIGTAWRTIGFNDASWKLGAGGFGVLFENSSLPVSFQTSLGLTASTYYFRRKFLLADVPQGGNFELTLAVNGGAIVYVNGVEVDRLRMPSHVDHFTRPNETRDNSNLEGIVISAEFLRQGENLIAVELHPREPDSHDALFAARLDKTTTTMSNAYADATAIFDGLRITEVMYHPSQSLLEYVRLENVGDTALELAGVELDGGISFEFSPQTLMPGEAVFVVENVAAFRAEYGNAPIAGAYFGKLNNAGDDLVINLPSPHNISALSFRFQEWWQPATDGRGSALQIVDPTGAAVTWNERTAWRSVVPDYSFDVVGDFNGDATIDDQDIDALCSETHVAAPRPEYDLDEDGAVGIADLRVLVEQILGHSMGDANLDGRVDAADLNRVGLHWLQAGDNLGWDMGNLNCDNIIDAADLNVVGLNWLTGVAAAAPMRGPRAALAIAVDHTMLQAAIEVQIEAAATAISADSFDSDGDRALDVLAPHSALQSIRLRGRLHETGPDVGGMESIPEHVLDEVFGELSQSSQFAGY